MTHKRFYIDRLRFSVKAISRFIKRFRFDTQRMVKWKTIRISTRNHSF